MAIKGNKTPAIDIYDQVFVAERLTGELGLYTTDKNQMLAAVTLPQNPLGRLRAMARLQMAGGLGTLAGRGLEFDEGRTRRSYARFPRRFLQRRWNVLRRFSKAGEFERQLAALDTGRLVIASGQEIKEDRAAQYGPFLLITRPTNKGGGYFEDLTLEVRDVRSFDALWSKPFGKKRRIIGWSRAKAQWFSPGPWRRNTRGARSISTPGWLSGWRR